MPAPPKYRQVDEQSTRLGREEPIAPFYRRAQGSMPRGRVRTSRGKSIESLVEALEHLRDRQDVRPCRCQLDRQGDSFEPAAQLGNEQRVVSRDLKVGTDGAGAIDEELHAFVMGKSFERVSAHERRRGKRLDHELTLARYAKHPSGRHEARQPRRRRHQSTNDGGGLGQQLLQVVENEERGPCPERREHPFQRGKIARRSTDDVADDVENPVRIVEVGQRNEPDGVVDLGRHLRGHLDCQPGLARASRSGQGHDALPFIDEHL